MKTLAGKKLLVLGGAANEISLVLRAQELGVYVIVADYHSDYTLSPAKKVADEAWDVSWSDLDVLEEKCRASGVNGVLAGYSEIRVEKMIQLCQRLDLPCYINMQQLDITRDKIKFKNACRENRVPVVKEFASVDAVDAFPVIVKPVDRAGSIGISVASNAAELQKAYAYAMEMSLCKQVIIEKFISDATKFDVYYQIVDGNVLYMSCNDVVNAKDNGTERVVQSAWLLPSVHEKYFLEKVDPNMREMIRNMGIQNGYIFFSGFADKQEEFVFFECGFRLCGGHYYDYFYRLGGYNTLDLLITYALCGKVLFEKNVRDMNPALKCATINVYSKAGKIASISGMDEIKKMPGCMLALTQARIGQENRDDTAILSKIAMFHLCGETAQELEESAQQVYRLLSVLGEHGEDLIYDRLDPGIIAHAWDE